MENTNEPMFTVKQIRRFMENGLLGSEEHKNAKENAALLWLIANVEDPDQGIAAVISRLDKDGEFSIISENTEKVVNLECEISDRLYSELIKYAKDNILSDEKALINWVVNKALVNYIEKYEP